MAQRETKLDTATAAAAASGGGDHSKWAKCLASANAAALVSQSVEPSEICIYSTVQQPGNQAAAAARRPGSERQQAGTSISRPGRQLEQVSIKARFIGTTRKEHHATRHVRRVDSRTLLINSQSVSALAVNHNSRQTTDD